MFVYQGFLKTGMPGKLGLALHLHQIGRVENLNDTFIQVFHVIGPPFCFLNPTT
jgi:hypothetical protein